MTPVMAYGPASKPTILVGFTDSDNRATADETSKAVMKRWSSALNSPASSSVDLKARPFPVQMADGTNATMYRAFVQRSTASTIGTVTVISYPTRGRFKTLVIYSPVVTSGSISQIATTWEIAKSIHSR